MTFKTGSVVSGASDDYAYLDTGPLEFYYGYEELIEGADRENGDIGPDFWAFTARVNGCEVMRIGADDMGLETGRMPEFYLLHGIGLYLEQVAKTIDVRQPY